MSEGLLHTTDDGRTVFFCPGCQCGHGILLAPGSWRLSGTAERPTIEPSVLHPAVEHAVPVDNGWEKARSPRCHLFVRDGQLVFLGDCDHALAGKTVPMEPF